LRWREPHGPGSAPAKFGERTDWLREGFGGLKLLTFPGTTVQYIPVWDDVLMSRPYSARQA
jgi:hypothetical protein